MPTLPHLVHKPGALTLTVLGSGSIIPTKERSSSAFVLETPQIHILLDCGTGTVRRLLEYGYNLSGINHIFITHTHPDHFADVVPLLSAKLLWELFAQEMKEEPSLNEFPIDLVGPPGLEQTTRAIVDLTHKSVLDGKRVPQFKVQFTEVSTTEFTRGDLNVKTVQTEQGEDYIPPSVAYLFTQGQKRILFSGDLRRIDEAVGLGIGGVDLLVIECSFPSTMPAGGHLNPALVAQAATKLQAKKVVLTHLYDFSVQRQDLAKEVRSAFSGEVVLGHDGLKIEL